MNSRPMSNIDKQGRQVQRYANFGVDMMEWDDGGYVKHSDYLALLDENLQLQRDKDSLEAVAISMRDDMREAREKLEAAEKRIAEQQSAIIAPGIMRCAGCGFVLTKNSINMAAGTITAGDSKSEPCPNGCGPLWPVTWKEQALQMRDDSEG